MSSAPDFWCRGPWFESDVFNNDPSSLQNHCVIMLNLRVKAQYLHPGPKKTTKKDYMVLVGRCGICGWTPRPVSRPCPPLVSPPTARSLSTRPPPPAAAASPYPRARHRSTISASRPRDTASSQQLRTRWVNLDCQSGQETVYFLRIGKLIGQRSCQKQQFLVRI